MSGNPLRQLRDEGMSVWLDYLDRDIMNSGLLQRLIDEDGVHGETSNPSIFQQGVSSGTEYAGDIARLTGEGKSVEEICWELMISDVQRACDIFRPLYDSSKGKHGYVSLELNPTLANETDASIDQGRELWKRVDRPNLMIKVPATEAGLPVVEALLRDGFNVNVTLLFAVQMYDKVIDTFFTALEKRLEDGNPIDSIASVASFFVSRADTEADKRLDKALESKPGLEEKIRGIRGRVAVANSIVAYNSFEEKFASKRWKELEERGASLQRPLWASTGTKSPEYSDILYVQELIGPHCVNTMPDKTMNNFRDHGKAVRTLIPECLKNARGVLAALAEVGVDLDDITTKTLLEEGVEKFEISYRELLDTIAKESGRND